MIPSGMHDRAAPPVQCKSLVHDSTRYTDEESAEWRANGYSEDEITAALTCGRPRYPEVIAPKPPTLPRPLPVHDMRRYIFNEMLAWRALGYYEQEIWQAIRNGDNRSLEKALPRLTLLHNPCRCTDAEAAEWREKGYSEDEIQAVLQRAREAAAPGIMADQEPPARPLPVLDANRPWIEQRDEWRAAGFTEQEIWRAVRGAW